MPPKKKVPANFAAVQRKRHQAQAPAQQEQQVDLDVEMPDVVGPGESMAGPNVVAAPPATDRPTFPRPPGPAPKVGGVELPWDREDGCWLEATGR